MNKLPATDLYKVSVSGFCQMWLRRPAQQLTQQPFVIEYHLSTLITLYANASTGTGGEKVLIALAVDC